MTANDRIQWFHKMISDGCYPNAAHLSERFGISHRQAQRDVDFLRREIGAPLVYSYENRGYTYTQAFTMPLMLATENDTDYHDVLESLQDFHSHTADRAIIQMQLPYTALLEIPDRMTVLNLRSIIVGEEPRHRYRCEFPSVELFLGIIMSTGAEIRVIEPEWLRARLVAFAKQVLACNENEEEKDRTEK